MNQIFLGEPSQEIKNWFIKTFISEDAYTILTINNGSTKKLYINGVATWKNIGVKNSQSSGDNTLKSCQLGNKITEISSHAFRYCRSLTSINIPNSVTSIGSEAFYQCTSLTSINIPNSVLSVGMSAFYNCSSLTSINIPSALSSIENQTFYNCHSLPLINIPSSVMSIGSNAFYNCSSLTSVIFEGRTLSSIMSMSNYPWGITNTSVIVPGITSQPSYTPSYTTLKFVDGTTKTKEIAGTVTWENIGVKSYSGAKDNTLKSCQLGNKVTEISSNAFSDCSSLTSINIPNSVNSIRSWAFTDCFSLVSINIPNSVTSIGDATFQGCRSLTSINIPNSVSSIGKCEFYDCPSLSSINIPSSVTSIDDFAFSYCSSLTSIVFEGKTMSQITSMAWYPWDAATSAIIPGIK